jgi:hypothetical protein
MAKNIDVRREIYDVLVKLNIVGKDFINNIIEGCGYAENSPDINDTIRKTRENIFKDFINAGFIDDKDDKYIVTDKLKNVRAELRELLKGDDSDIRNVVTKLNRSINNNNDRNMGFVTQYSLNSSFLENSIIEAKVRDCTLFLSLLSKMLEDDEEKKAS